MPSKNPNNHATRFKDQGKQLKSQQQPLAVRFPPLILDYLKSREDTQDFVRAAVVEKLERDALLPSVAIAPTPSPPPATKTHPTFWVRLGKLANSPIGRQSQRDIIANQPDMYGRVLTKSLARLTKFEEVRSLSEVQNIPNAKIFQ